MSERTDLCRKGGVRGEFSKVWLFFTFGGEEEGWARLKTDSYSFQEIILTHVVCFGKMQVFAQSKIELNSPLWVWLLFWLPEADQLERKANVCKDGITVAQQQISKGWGKKTFHLGKFFQHFPPFGINMTDEAGQTMRWGSHFCTWIGVKFALASL